MMSQLSNLWPTHYINCQTCGLLTISTVKPVAYSVYQLSNLWPTQYISCQTCGLLNISTMPSQLCLKPASAKTL